MRRGDGRPRRTSTPSTAPQGWQQVEKETGPGRPVVQVPTEWNADKFYTGVANALQAHPEANCMFVASDYAFQGVEKALQEAGKLAPTGDPKHMWIAAQDVNPRASRLGEGLHRRRHLVRRLLPRRSVRGHGDQAAERREPGCHKDLVPGRVVTQDNYKTMPNLWAWIKGPAVTC